MKCTVCTAEGADERGLCPACRAASAVPTLGRGADPARVASAFHPGEAFGGRYQIVELVGIGGMGEVYKAIDRQLDRTVALKLMRPGLDAQADALPRFRRELALALSVTHPNVCRVHDLGEVEGTLFLSMEFVTGQSLRDLIRSVGRLSPRQTVALGRQICAGLEAIHARDIVHRDLKPGNIMVDRDGQAVVMDFGLAHQPGEGALTGSGTVLGTLAYLAPEQARGQGTDARSDLYSLGLILFEMLTGIRPPGDGGPLPLAARGANEPCPPPSRFSPEVHPSLDAVVMRCLQRNPARRFASARDLGLALTEAEASLSTDLGVRARLPSWAARSTWRRRGLAAAAVLAAVLLPLGLWRLMPSPAPPPPATDRLVIAVLPLDNLGGDPTDDHFGAGLAEAMVTSLASNPSLTVVSRGSTLEEFRRLRDTRKLARELGVSYLVGGGFQRLGDLVRFSLTLIRPDASVAWGESYEDRLANLWALQGRAADGVRGALRLPPDPVGRHFAASPPTADAGALAEYTRGRALLERPDQPGNVARAVERFEAAVKRDPAFALAHAGLGEALWARYDETKEPAWARRAQDAISQALKIDGSLPAVRAVLARIYDGTGRTELAIQQLREVVALRSGSDEAHALLGRILGKQGRTEEAVAEIQTAIELRPRYWAYHSALGGAYYNIARYDKAILAFEQAARLQPDNSRPLQQLGTAYQAAGNDARALDAYRRALRLGPDSRAYNNIGVIHYDRGEYREAAEAFEQADRLEPGVPRRALNLGDAYRRLGRPDDARAYYERGVERCRSLLRVNPQDAETLSELGLFEAKLGRRAEAARHAGEAARLLPSDGDVLYNKAVVLALAEARLEALEGLRQALDNGYSIALARQDEDLASLKELSEFKELMNRSQ